MKNDIVNTRYTIEQSKEVISKLIKTKEFRILEEFLKILKNLSPEAMHVLSNNLRYDQEEKVIYGDIWFSSFGVHTGIEGFEYKNSNDLGCEPIIEISKHEKFEIKLRFWKPMPLDPYESSYDFRTLDFQIDLACTNGNEIYFLDITDYYDIEHGKWYKEFYHLFVQLEE